MSVGEAVGGAGDLVSHQGGVVLPVGEVAGAVVAAAVLWVEVEEGVAVVLAPRVADVGGAGGSVRAAAGDADPVALCEFAADPAPWLFPPADRWENRRIAHTTTPAQPPVATAPRPRLVLRPRGTRLSAPDSTNPSSTTLALAAAISVTATLSEVLPALAPARSPRERTRGIRTVDRTSWTWRRFDPAAPQPGQDSAPLRCLWQDEQ